MTSIGGKNIGEYIKILKTPLIILIVLALIQGLFNLLVVGIQNLPMIGGYVGILGGLIGLVINGLALVVFIGVTGYAGHYVVEEHQGTLVTAAVSGAILGAVTGLVAGLTGIIISLITIFTTGFSITAMVTAMVGSLASIILAPILGIVMGLIISTIGGFIAGSDEINTKELKNVKEKID